MLKNHILKMKKNILTLAFIVASFLANAQQHSDLWQKVDDIRKEKFAESYYNPITIVDGYGFSYANVPLITIDDKIAFKNLADFPFLDQYTLSQVAKIDYWGKESKNYIIFGGNGYDGIIFIYTKQYLNDNPNLISKLGSRRSPDNKTVYP
jgi:hypothetical protein